MLLFYEGSRLGCFIGVWLRFAWCFLSRFQFLQEFVGLFCLLYQSGAIKFVGIVAMIGLVTFVYGVFQFCHPRHR